MESPYEGPEAVQVLQLGTFSLKVVLPADPERLLDEPEVLELNRRDDYMPYWAFLWPAASWLAEAVLAEPWSDPATLNALEIGCGLGVGGLAALARGFRSVHFTDYDQTPLTFVAKSLRLNAFDPDRWETSRLDWRDAPNRQYPIILGADVLYERPLVPRVVALLQKMLAPGGLALLTSPYRQATDDLEPQLAETSLRLESRPISTRDPQGRRVDGTVYRVSAPGGTPSIRGS